MQDLFLETIALQRIALVTRLIAREDCTVSDRDMALAWLCELTADLETKLDMFEIKNPHDGGCSGGSGGAGLQ